MATLEELELKSKRVEMLAAAHPELGGAALKGKSLLDAYKQQVAAQHPTEPNRLAQEINDRVDSASRLVTLKPQSHSWQEQVKPALGMLMLVVVFGLLGYFMYSYGGAVGLGRLTSIDGTRPLLVVAAIVSTIAFGGALIIGSLFSSEGTLQERFRLAREIFLVFSGVFGTVMGFYFGASDTKSASFGLDATLQDATVVAYATGGTAPYKMSLSYGKGTCTITRESPDGWARFNLDKKTDNISDGKILAIDGKGMQASFDQKVKADELKKTDGWTLPEQPCVAPAKPAAPKTGARTPTAASASG